MRKRKEDLVEEVRIFILNNGRYPTHKDCKENSKLSGANTYLRYLGPKKDWLEYNFDGFLQKEKRYCVCCKIELNGLNQKIFCSRSCSAKYNNGINPKRKKVIKFEKIKTLNLKNEIEVKCLLCKNFLDSRQVDYNKNQYCSTLCLMESKHQNRIKEFNKGENLKLASKALRHFLLKIDGNKCTKCKNTHWNGLPIPIEVEHVDGNSENNTRKNLCLLCPSCHAQTPTYKSKNAGNGRAYRRQRYKEGKSF